jgi:hypothetical protein
MDGDETVTLGFANGRAAVWVAEQTRSGRWGPLTRVAGRGSVFYGLEVVVNRAGDALLGWDSVSDGDHPVEAVYRPRASGWGPVTRLSSAKGDSGGLALALEPDGDAVSAWLRSRGNGDEGWIQARSFRAR